MDVWTRLARALGEAPPHAVATPAGGRIGGALVLLSDPGDGDLEVVYTRRHDDLANHPGQVSFPGGRVERSETVEHAAVREAVEEIALDPASVEVLGRLPALYVPPSRFWLVPVVARWRAPHPLVPAEVEVADILRVRLSSLHDERTWRVARLSTMGDTWAWQLDERNLLWGATAYVTGLLLAILDPAWHGGVSPAELRGDREVRPWQTAPRDAGPTHRALLPDTPERPFDPGRAAVASSGRPTFSRVGLAGQAVATAASRLLGERGGQARVLVLAGAGGTGAVGLRAAKALATAGVEARVRLAEPPARLRPVAATALTDVADRARVFDGGLPPADVVIDALVGTGLSGPLGREALAVVHALRHHDVPILSVDTPSGLDALAGLVGECVPADVTVALGAAHPGLFHAGVGPYVGDVYLAELDEANPENPFVRLLADVVGGRS